MNALLAILGEDALKFLLPILAAKFAELAEAKEPEIKAFLVKTFGDGNALVDEVYQLLIEPGLVTIGGLLQTVGGPAPVALAAKPQPAPQYNDD